MRGGRQQVPHDGQWGTGKYGYCPMSGPESPEMQPVSGDTLSQDGFGITNPDGLSNYWICLVHCDVVIYHKNYIFIWS